MARRVSIFGATGSIGQNTLDLIRRGEGFDVVALSGAGNVAQLAADALEFGAELAVTADLGCEADLREALAGSGVEVLAGPDGLVEAAKRETDWAMSAIVGAAGLAPTMALARSSDTLALANKESLVCAGSLLKAECAKHGTRLLPVDSEHSAIFQALQGEEAKAVERVILTASGGPFRGYSREQLKAVTLEQARKHPNWDMGLRITIDSASMFNKALEVIEAKYLFDLEPQQIEVVVHPQSIVHSAVGYCDGSILAQMGPPDMRGAIGYALNYPERQDLPVERIDLAKLARLDFEAPDEDAFASLRLVREALEIGGAAGCVFNAAKEAALDAFIVRKIAFLDMGDIVERVLHKFATKAAATKDADGIEAIHMLDEQARQFAAQMAAEIAA